MYLFDGVLKGLDKPKKTAQIVLLGFQQAFDFVDYTVAITEL